VGQASAGEGREFGIFDFDLRGGSNDARLGSVLDHGYSGLVMPMNLARYDAYRASRPGFRLYAAYIMVDHRKLAGLSAEYRRGVFERLAASHAAFWLIVNGPKEPRASVLATIVSLADRTAMDTAEEALSLLHEAQRPNLALSVHLCHELRAGNGDRLDEILKAVGPLLRLPSISGSDSDAPRHRGQPTWADAIKPLGEGDYDASRFMRALLTSGYTGPVILHTFGLGKRPATHVTASLDLLRAWSAASALPTPPGFPTAP
jgi:hypothetical protein